MITGDGLRADKAFQYFPDPSPSAGNDSASLEPRPLAPFLRSRVLEHGTFGVSHTRVPTESRPGHVALIAGLYEDVSAVTTGWKLNPVNFDSVFNRSRHTWSWGSPDILPMFSTGAVPGRVEDATYGHEFEDFSKDATELDFWVFDRVKQLFKDAETDAELNAKLRQDKLVFFLHLLGLDTSGHAYRPYSREYLHNIKIVDEGVREITELINNFYDDEDTAFVFTADHGMSDWGSHGDGHPDNTRTPLIAWGSGVSKPVKVESGKAPGHEDGFSSDWHLDHIQRHDVAQADVATLMAYLTGLEYPVNSVGELPLPFIDADDKEKAKAMLVNARQILEMYRVKEEEKMATEFRYRPYHGFATAEQTVDHRLSVIQQTINDGEYEQAIESSDELMQFALQGLRYLQTYDWLFLRTLITAGYLGWIAFAFTTAIDLHVLDGNVKTSRTTTSIAAFGSFLVALYSFLYARSSPPQYYAYAFFPIMFWEEVFARRQALAEGKRKLFAEAGSGSVMKLGLNFVMYIGILEVMVSFHSRFTC
jgi:phosphatidylinositol glycan class N